jgi:hypothetical protein
MINKYGIEFVEGNCSSTSFLSSYSKITCAHHNNLRHLRSIAPYELTIKKIKYFRYFCIYANEALPVFLYIMYYCKYLFPCTNRKK